jgi:competence protein ComEA
VPVAADAPVSAPSALVTPTAAAPAEVGGSPSASPSTTIVVDVAGKVRRPGIATLPLGARVVDALEAAGGVRKGVRLGSLNLARVLTDGEQVLVGVPAAAGVAASAAGAPASGAAAPMVNINTAAQSELETLPGVGPVTAQAILQWRTENGAFTAVDELLEVSGIGEATLAKIAPYVTL